MSPIDVSIIERQQQHSLKRLKEVRERIEKIEGIAQHSGLCIYATGSYGRLEASEYSDLDLFMIQEDGLTISNIAQTLLKADLIRACRDLRFPEFSGDGEYLVLHNIDQILKDLGSPADDAKNFFTARMLLLLESRPLLNDAIYDSILDHVVESYYRDYHDHTGEFQPVFLINDILRYWKTLCLNYEHKRNLQVKDLDKQKKARVKNLKLKFSRLWTCFSLVIPLTHQGNMSPEELMKLIKLPPLDRVKSVADKAGQAENLNKALELYASFLHMVNRPPKDLETYLSTNENRAPAFDQARQFGDCLYNLMKSMTSDKLLRYMIM